MLSSKQFIIRVGVYHLSTAICNHGRRLGWADESANSKFVPPGIYYAYAYSDGDTTLHTLG